MKRTPLQRKTALKRSPMRKRHKKSSYTKELREGIYERDNEHCQICGGPGEQVHHVIPKGRFYSKWYTFDNVHNQRNLMLVCHRCHERITTNNDELEAAIELQEQRFGALRRHFG